MNQSDLYTFLCKWLTAEKMNRFDEVVSQRTRHITLVSEDIYQTQNASALLRTAECCGIQDIHIIENTNSFTLNKRVVKGAASWLTIKRFNKDANNSESCFHHLKNHGYKLVVTSPHNATHNLFNIPLDHKLAIIMGSELKGASETAMTMSDYRLTVPMTGFTESLNVSVAAGLIGYELTRKLRSSSIHWQLSEEEKLELKIEWAKKSIQSSKQLMELFEKGELV